MIYEPHNNFVPNIIDRRRSFIILRTLVVYFCFWWDYFANFRLWMDTKNTSGEFQLLRLFIQIKLKRAYALGKRHREWKSSVFTVHTGIRTISVSISQLLMAGLKWVPLNRAALQWLSRGGHKGMSDLLWIGYILATCIWILNIFRRLMGDTSHICRVCFV